MVDILYLKTKLIVDWQFQKLAIVRIDMNLALYLHIYVRDSSYSHIKTNEHMTGFS